MLRLSANLSNLPVMSLRTGGKVATATRPLINPHNLKIEGWLCTDSRQKNTLVLLSNDVRDFVPQGIAINDYDDLTEPEELIRLQEVLELDFQILGKPVITNHKRKVGKVADYALDTTNMLIQKLYVARPMRKSLTTGQLSIDRSQIVEITQKRVIVKDVDVKVGAGVVSAVPAAS